VQQKEERQKNGKRRTAKERAKRMTFILALQSHHMSPSVGTNILTNDCSKSRVQNAKMGLNGTERERSKYTHCHREVADNGTFNAKRAMRSAQTNQTQHINGEEERDNLRYRYSVRIGDKTETKKNGLTLSPYTDLSIHSFRSITINQQINKKKANNKLFYYLNVVEISGTTSSILISTAYIPRGNRHRLKVDRLSR